MFLNPITPKHQQEHLKLFYFQLSRDPIIYFNPFVFRFIRSLIFPDLNAGNNGYKAVQQASKTIAVGPVLQGLKKPVNDLSRGATVDDIVNTAVITALQAAEDDV